MLVEIITFKTKEATTEEQLLAASEKMDSFCKNQEGFTHRSLSQNEDGLWYDVIYWDTKDAFDKAEAAFQQDEVCGAFMAIIDSETLSLQRSLVKTALSGCEEASNSEAAA